MASPPGPSSAGCGRPDRMTPIRRLRLVGIVEAISFLLLVGIAMPLKYGFDMPMAVKVVGWAHGVLFVAFCVVLYAAMNAHEWSFFKGAKYFIAALIPFGPFLVDKGLKEEDKAHATGS